MLSMGLKNSVFKSGLDVKSGVVKSGKINIIKTYKNLGLMKSEMSLNQVTKTR